MTFLVIAYGLIWIFVFGYVWLISQQQKRLERQLTAVQEQLQMVQDADEGQ